MRTRNRFRLLSIRGTKCRLRSILVYGGPDGAITDYGSHLEKLFAAYKESMGSECPDVPAELVQAAVRISDQHASIGSDGPSDAVDKGEGQGVAATCAEEPELSSAGIIDGSGESWSPIQLWVQ